MSIVDIHNRMTSSEEEHRAQQASDASLLFFTGSPSQVEKFAADFMIGDKWSDRYSQTHDGMLALDQQGITLRPGRSVVIEVAERLIVPFNMYGLVIPTGSLFMDRGIILAAAKIEPGFSGRLKLRLVNTGTSAQTLTRGMKVASGVFFGIEVTRHQNTVEKTAKLQPAQPTWHTVALRWAKGNPAIWIGWLIQIAVSSMAVLLVTYLFLIPAHTKLPASPAVENTPVGKSAPPTSTAPARKEP